MHVLYDTTAAAIGARAALGFAVAATIAFAAHRARALTRSGAWAAVVIGTAGFAFGGELVAVAILIFFLGGSVLSRVRNATADRARSHAAKAGQRDAAQVLANGSVAIACALFSVLAAHAQLRWSIAAVCALAAASGDTWSTEIGSLVGGRAKMITTGRAVESGTSGAISVAGSLAAPVGGAFVGLAGLSAVAGLSWLVWLALTALAGLAGSAIDSLIGATLQGTWRCPICGPVEVSAHDPCATEAMLVRGWPQLDNDRVNFVATLCGAALGYILAPT